MTPENTWPKGFTPDPETPWYLVSGQAEDHFAEQVRVAALAWCQANLTGELMDWSEGFAIWCEERARAATWPRSWRMPSFARSWRTFYAEPVDYDGDGCFRDDDGNCTNPEHEHEHES